MNRRLIIVVPILVSGLLLGACGSGDGDAPQAPAVSGRIEAGLRVLTLDPAATDQEFIIYRGDYVRPETAAGGPFTIEIPSLDVTHSVPAPEGERPYFKVPEAGRYPFTAGPASGVIVAIEYTEVRYREVGARDAAGVIANLDPLILDVRTEREFREGHLDGAVLMPVQEIQRRVGELSGQEDRPVLIYCRSGNRSTVAAKVLIDAGFQQVINLRRGINEWNREGLPTVK